MEHDFDSAHKGGNRYATILMYMSDLGPEDGGETVFPDGWPPHLAEENRVSTDVVSTNSGVVIVYIASMFARENVAPESKVVCFQTNIFVCFTSQRHWKN